MNSTAQPLLPWIGQTLVAGGVLLLAARVLMLVSRNPNRRAAVADWSLRAALLLPLLALLPSWWHLPRPELSRQSMIDLQFTRVISEQPLVERPAIVEDSPSTSFVIVVPSESGNSTVEPSQRQNSASADRTPAETANSPATSRWSVHWSTATIIAWVACIYLAIAGLLLARWLAGHVALWRLVQRSRPAEGRALGTFVELTHDWPNLPRLRVANGLRVPVCFGLWRPTIVLPEAVANQADHRSLRCVLAHELAHLQHGDAWSCFLSGLAQVVYWPLPWAWSLMRQLRLCQEFRADAAAARLTGGAEEYAALLVDLSRSLAGGSRRYAVATAVFSNSSDLFRRIVMLLKFADWSGRGSRRWSLVAAGSFLSLAVLLAGFGWSRTSFAKPVDEPPKPEDKKKDDSKKDAKKDAKNDKDKGPKARPFPVVPRVPGGDNIPEEYQKWAQQLMEQMMRRFPQGQNFPNLPNFDRFGGFAGQGRRASARLGVAVEKPSAALVDHLDLPKDQGLVVHEVTADSAAEKAGLKANDILLEIGGKPVANDVVKFRKQLSDIKTDTAINALILRKGKRETIKGIKLPEAKAEADEVPVFGFEFDGPRIKVIPAPPVPPVPPVPPLPPGGPALPPLPPVPGGNFNQLSVQITNGQFTIRSQKDGVAIHVAGSAEDGDTKVTSVTVRDGDDSYTTTSIDKLPEKYRETVKDLLKSVQVKKAK